MSAIRLMHWRQSGHDTCQHRPATGAKAQRNAVCPPPLLSPCKPCVVQLGQPAAITPWLLRTLPRFQVPLRLSTP